MKKIVNKIVKIDGINSAHNRQYAALLVSRIGTIPSKIAHPIKKYNVLTTVLKNFLM